MSVQAEKEHFVLGAQSVPEDSSPIESLQGTLQVFKNPKHPNWVWIYTHGTTKLRSRIL